MKVLYVEVVNGGAQMVGVNLRPSRRLVKIWLTPEQSKLVEPLAVGQSGGNVFYEDVRPICIQDETVVAP